MGDQEKGSTGPEQEIKNEKEGGEGDAVTKGAGEELELHGGEITSHSSRPSVKTWGSKLSYILTLVGYAVGFGNIWRFPYMMRENGGIVFLIPYFTMLAILGVPIFFLELAVGQRRRKGIVYCWHEISPSYGGLGICCAWICYTVGLYYTTLLAYSISYFYDSFRNPLPWTSCATVSKKPEFQHECEVKVDRPTKYYYYKKTLRASTGLEEAGEFNWRLSIFLFISWAVNWIILSMDATVSTASISYVTAVFPYVVLTIFFIANWTHDGAKAWRGLTRLLTPDYTFLYKPIVWMKAGSQIFYSLGLGSSIPVFASHNPIRYDCLKDSVTVSLVNAFSSLFAAFVVFPMMGKMGHRKYDECVSELREVFPNLNDMWSENGKNYYDIYSYIYSANKVIIRYGLGEWSEDETESIHKGIKQFKDYGKPLGYKYAEEITCDSACITSLKKVGNCSITFEATSSGSGSGFVFVGFTLAVLEMPGANFWAAIFFLMLFMLGIDSGYGTIEGAVAAIEEMYRLKRWAAAAIVCGSLTLVGTILFSFGFGSYILDVIDQWTANWTILIIALTECIAVAWSYDLAKFAYDVHLMTGRKPSVFMLVCWKYLTPIILVILLFSSIIEYIVEAKDNGLVYKTFDPKNSESVGGEHEKEYPWYTLTVGVVLMIFCVIWLPLQAFLRHTKHSLLKDEPPSDFPEEELRLERNIDLEKEEDQFTPTEKKIIGKTSLTSLQKRRDQQKSSEKGKRRLSKDSKRSAVSL